jgi:hypothetical protein
MRRKKTVIFITTKITEQEYRFIEFARRLGYGEVNLIIAEGQPQKTTHCLKSIRFDINDDRTYTKDIPKEDD